MKAPYECVFCGSIQLGNTLVACERMLGLGDKFTYNECGQCHSLQIARIPDDLFKYYPSNYYSFNSKRSPKLKNFLKTNLALKALDDRLGLSGTIASKFISIPDVVSWLKSAKIDRDARILDVGCGTGKLLRQLYDMGYSKVSGVDPYLPANVETHPITIHRKELSELDGKYDFIMFHHSLEHMANPSRIIGAAKALLSPNGKLLIRLPVAGSWAFKHYKEHWVQLDAPRHLSIPSPQGMEVVAAKNGLVTLSTVYDSNEFQFYGSEMYLRGLPLAGNNPRNFFSAQELKNFRIKSQELNLNGNGDAASFYFGRK